LIICLPELLVISRQNFYELYVEVRGLRDEVVFGGNDVLFDNYITGTMMVYYGINVGSVGYGENFTFYKETKQGETPLLTFMLSYTKRLVITYAFCFYTLILWRGVFLC
jgi:hypothetical protein